MSVYYNECDRFAVEWLRQLMIAKQIPDGYIDSRSIVDVDIDDLKGFTHCHFFAGIGVWAYALQRAGWPSDREIWTGSCPCQPFSSAGKQKGFDDSRHLWPVWANLIALGLPATVIGEQVASPAGLHWFDLVSTDLEDQGYAIAAADLCAAGVGAPHIRQRLYWLADTNNARSQGRDRTELSERAGQRVVGASGASGELGHTASLGQFGRRLDHGSDSSNERVASSERSGVRQQVAERSAPCGLADSDRSLASDSELQRSGRLVQLAEDTPAGFWSAADWLYCRDDKYRPVEPGTFPLAHGATARVGRLRGYGNALCAEVATAFIESFLDVDKGIL